MRFTVSLRVQGPSRVYTWLGAHDNLKDHIYGFEFQSFIWKAKSITGWEPLMYRDGPLHRVWGWPEARGQGLVLRMSPVSRRWQVNYT